MWSWSKIMLQIILEQMRKRRTLKFQKIKLDSVKEEELEIISQISKDGENTIKTLK